MTPQEKYDRLLEISRSPGGLKKVVDSLFTDKKLVRKVCKDVNEMADKVIFFYKGEVVWQFILPWNISNKQSQDELTKQYKFLLDQK